MIPKWTLVWVPNTKIWFQFQFLLKKWKDNIIWFQFQFFFKKSKDNIIWFQVPTAFFALFTFLSSAFFLYIVLYPAVRITSDVHPFDILTYVWLHYETLPLHRRSLVGSAPFGGKESQTTLSMTQSAASKVAFFHQVNKNCVIVHNFGDALFFRSLSPWGEDDVWHEVKKQSLWRNSNGQRC